MSEHFNGLTPAQAERLAVLSEECGEVVQAIGKILRHGYESAHPNGGPTNRHALECELGHLLNAACMMEQADDICDFEVQAACVKKAGTIHRYTHHQRDK